MFVLELDDGYVIPQYKLDHCHTRISGVMNVKGHISIWFGNI
jgi:hypothetical protein